MIELKNVSFEYENTAIFENLSLSVAEGEKIGIIGESGCGKSTLLKLMAGLYVPSSGVISVDGVSRPDEIIKKISVVMQSPMLLPLSIIEKWIDSLPEGLDTYLGDRADELSGGQAQRIAIARAMFKDANILLLDEPTSALDGENAASVLEAISHFTHDKTVVHVTHRKELLEGYDRVYLMKNGKLSEA